MSIVSSSCVPHPTWARIATCITTSSWLCSTTCSASGEGRVLVCQPYGHRLHRDQPRTSGSKRSWRPTDQAGMGAGQLQHFIPEEEFDYNVRTSISCEEGMEAAPPVHLRRGVGWSHRDGQPVPPLTLEGFLDDTARQRMTAEIGCLADLLAEAEKILDAPVDPIDPGDSLPSGSEALRWFPLPHEMKSDPA